MVGAVVGSEVVGSEVVGAAVGAEVGLHVSPETVGRVVVGAKVVGASVGASVGAGVGAAVGAGVGDAVGVLLGCSASQQEAAQKWFISRSREYRLSKEMNVQHEPSRTCRAQSPL